MQTDHVHNLYLNCTLFSSLLGKRPSGKMCAVLNIAPASVYLRDVGWSVEGAGDRHRQEGLWPASGREPTAPTLAQAAWASPGLTARWETSVAACARGAHYSAREGGKPETEGLTHLLPGTCWAQALPSASNAPAHKRGVNGCTGGMLSSGVPGDGV